MITGQHQLDLGEPEFARLLQAATAGGSWERAAGVLRRIGAELTVLQPGTLRRIRALFASPAAAASTADGSSSGGGAWAVEATTVSDEGRCSTCGGQLAALDLSLEEFETFAGGIASIAERQVRACGGATSGCGAACIRLAVGQPVPTALSTPLPPPPPSAPPAQERRPNDFQAFRAWLERHGPFGAVIDGANVALYGQNFEKGGFNFGQIK